MVCAPTETLDEAVEISDDQDQTEIEPVKIAPSPVLPSASESPMPSTGRGAGSASKAGPLANSADELQTTVPSSSSLQWA